MVEYTLGDGEVKSDSGTFIKPILVQNYKSCDKATLDLKADLLM